MGRSPVERLAVALPLPAALTPIIRVLLFLGIRSVPSEILNIDKGHLTALFLFSDLEDGSLVESWEATFDDSSRFSPFEE
jgi:hypothetical protein